MEAGRWRTTSAGAGVPRVVVRWWRDGQGYHGVDDALEYRASGTSYDDLRQHVADSAEREGWPAWSLVADHTSHPYERSRRDAPGRCGACGLSRQEHSRDAGLPLGGRPSGAGRRSRD